MKYAVNNTINKEESIFLFKMLYSTIRQICSPREREQIELQLALLIDTRFVSARRAQRSTVCFRFSLSAIRSPYCLGENRAIKSNFLPRVTVNVKQLPSFEDVGSIIPGNSIFVFHLVDYTVHKLSKIHPELHT